ncbi:hypothetical protein VF14_13490 [Nostoc linckia z18]|uniref:Uncharacterized protein n=2 Tax=Nostoc linckia TaxID=92942 RepID=A0A9Q5ZC27_NOSLI|nr:hypothetical protein [Nostoc linckia]PHK42268.1 hypothetical protein VF12_03675 [Nostoc linckia z15]PHK45475.1 hypothetical protein VF13_16125 [Nostoc linckia z16]PHJ59053.1 hypothetical protein VF02_26110 [Nostoc linckia z1]PHJ61906.1 hypothetical protein VF05_27805 [Nostoc linckia z3]PHJ67823.1 hypothetical protein VF03_25555 [Nostoc linckia z2]
MTKKPKGWYKEIVIRPVAHVDGYESYEKICSFVADIYYSTEEQKLLRQLRTNPGESIYITLYTLFKVGQAKCPAYWVNKDLLEALLQSVLTVEIESLNWAMKTGMFMLPKGVILSPENRSVDAIFWNYDSEADILYWAATDGSSSFCRRFKLNGQKVTYTDSEDIDPKVVKGFNEYLQSIFLRLILIMECRPELVDTTSEVIRINKGFGKAQAQDFYQPLWLGLGYRFKREGTQSSEGSSGTHGTKSVHWRRGFLRNQPYGEGRQQRKLVWIEPVLVMGGKES